MCEFNKKFEEKARNEKKVFSFGNTKVVAEKVEDEVNEFLHQEVTWTKVKNFLFQEVTFGKKKNL